MKYPQLNKIPLFLSILLLGFCLGGCHNDAEEVTVDDPDVNTITLSLVIVNEQLPGSTRVMDYKAQAYIDPNEVDVLVFKANATAGEPEVLAARLEVKNVKYSTPGVVDKWEVKFKVPEASISDVTTLAIVANAKSAVDVVATDANLDVMTKPEVLTALQVSNTGIWDSTIDVNSVPSAPIPMYAEYDISNIGLKGGITLPDNILLVRMLARVDVINNADNFVLNKVHVVNYNTVGSIAPQWNTTTGAPDPITNKDKTNPMLPASPGTALYSANSANKLTYGDDGSITAAQKTEGEIFIFEANAADNTSLTTLTDGICLVLEGEYEDAGVSFYRIDFYKVDESSNENIYIPVHRNHHYKFTITGITNTGHSDIKTALETRGSNTYASVTLHQVDANGFNHIVFNREHYVATKNGMKEQMTYVGTYYPSPWDKIPWPADPDASNLGMAYGVDFITNANSWKVYHAQLKEDGTWIPALMHDKAFMNGTEIPLPGYRSIIDVDGENSVAYWESSNLIYYYVDIDTPYSFYIVVQAGDLIVPIYKISYRRSRT